MTKNPTTPVETREAAGLSATVSYELSEGHKRTLCMAVSELEEQIEMLSGFIEATSGKNPSQRFLIHLWGGLEGTLLRLSAVAGVEVEPSEPPCSLEWR